MKVLVGTTEGQGKRANDFSFTNELELVGFGFECDGEAVDGSCGCRRSMVGLESGKATTTMRVVEALTVDSVADLAERVFGGLDRGGWVALMGESEAREQALTDAQEIVRIADVFPVGTIVEKRGNRFQIREGAEQS